MVLGPILRQLLATVVLPIVLPIMKRYTDIFVMRVHHGIASGTLRKEFLKMMNQVKMSTGLIYPQMTDYQARRILDFQQIKGSIQPKVVLDKYYIMLLKNDPQKGGSLYLQAKIFSAKQFLVKDIKNIDQIQQDFIKQFGIGQQRFLNDKQSDQNNNDRK